MASQDGGEQATGKVWTQEMVEVDGRVHEGGGQVVRVALALAAAAGKSVAVSHIRANRKPPGMRPQHLLGARLVASISSASLKGDEKKSERLELLHPKGIRGGLQQCYAETAASCALFAQCAVPPLLVAHTTSQVELTGGTDVPMAPSIDYLAHVFAPALNRCMESSGAKLNVECTRRGFNPQGGGKVTLYVTPIAKNVVDPFDCVYFGKLQRFQLYTFGPKEAARIAAHSAKQCIAERLHVEVCCTTDKKYEQNEQGGLLVSAVSDEGWVLGVCTPLLSTKKASEAAQAGREAALEVLTLLKRRGCTDSHLQDQLLVFMAMAEGTSRLGSCCAPTAHALAVMYVAEQVVGARFVVREPSTDTEPWIITCHGAGLKSSLLQ